MERAAVFERAFATSPWTLPSVGSLFTGHIPSRHGAGLPLAPGGERRFASLDASVRLLGSLFQEHGFATAAVANNPFLHPGFGLARGFDAELEGQLRALGYLE
ncbi:MAG: sulfatase-like hydrolase/transferase [Myxococcota bacterium]|nr:sulfatase-like hydrolase/transferase [Myxococcota bacterium]